MSSSSLFTVPRSPPGPIPSILRAPSAPLPDTKPPTRWNRFTRRVATLLRPSKAAKEAEKEKEKAKDSRFVKSVTFGDIYYHEPAPPPPSTKVHFPISLPHGFSSLPKSVLFRVSAFCCWHELLRCRSISRYYYFHFSHEDAFQTASLFDPWEAPCFAHECMNYGLGKQKKLSGEDGGHSHPNQHDLDAGEAHPYSQIYLEQVLFSVPFARSLWLANYSLNSASIITLTRFALLQHVNLSNCRPPSCQPINRILPALRGLRILSLDLSSTILFFPEHFAEIAQFPRLLSLQIARSRVQSDCLKHLPQLSTLKILNLCNNSSLGDFSLTPLEFAPDLRGLYLDDCHFSLPALRHTLSFLPQLVQLSFSIPANACDDAFFESLVQTHPNLEILHLNRLIVFHQSQNEPTGLTELTLQYLAQMKRLVQLKFQAIHFAPDALATLCQALPSLRRFAFTLEEHQTYHQTFTAIAQMPKLDSLYLFTAAPMNDEYFKLLWPSKSLRYANVRNWHSVTQPHHTEWQQRVKITHYSTSEMDRYERFHCQWLFPANYTARWPLEQLEEWKEIMEVQSRFRPFQPEYEVPKKQEDWDEFSLTNPSSNSSLSAASPGNPLERPEVSVANTESKTIEVQVDDVVVEPVPPASGRYSPRSPKSQSPRASLAGMPPLFRPGTPAPEEFLSSVLVPENIHGTPVPSAMEPLDPVIEAITAFKLDAEPENDKSASSPQKTTQDGNQSGQSNPENPSTASKQDTLSVHENGFGGHNRRVSASRSESHSAIHLSPQKGLERDISAASDGDLDGSFEIRFHDEE